jgi:ribulose-phosphate 3-epimerase
VPWKDWIRTVEVEPSVYAADFAYLGEQVDALLRTGARILHFDVGDGHFVEPVTIGPIVLKSLAPIVHRIEGAAIDVHLMVENPVKYFQPVAEAGGDSVTFHYEAVDDVAATVAAARELELQVGLAFKPGTDPAEVAKVAEGVDIVLCMSIEPGYSGQEYLPDATERVKQIRSLLPPEIHVQVDGGITNENVREVYDAGATLLVAGSAIFAREDLPRAYRRLVQALA